MSAIDNTPRAKAEALVGEVLTAALSTGEITVNRARDVTAALEAAMAPPEGYVLVPVQPTSGLLMSMAMRADHALGCPGYYDQQMFKIDGHVSHQRMLEVALAEARKQHEEVVGAGFYSPEKEGGYAAMLAGRPEVSGG